jgi:geranylgeranyl reductase family protein
MASASPQNTCDVCVVGAGPTGATCAYYLAKRGIRVLLLERQRFPRDKLCGDAICTRAQVHLKRMGVLQEILAEGKGNWAVAGGFVSPAGISYVGRTLTEANEALVIAIKRIVLDEKVARAAARAGADLVEEYPVAGAELDAAAGLWTVRCRTAGKPTYRARALVAADGASSPLARSLGLVTTPPEAVCSRCYVKADTTAFDADGMVYYPRDLLPGYVALFREAGGDLNYCCYLLPGGRSAPADLNRLHGHVARHDPGVSRALGPNPKMGPMRGGGLRLGGIARSYADHVLVVGDAAGHIDPMTGEGIQYGMDAAELAAETLAEALTAGDLRAGFLKRYQDRWQRAFGRDFVWSRRLSRLSARFPALLDAWAAATRRHGAGFLEEWATVMTGARPKSGFLRPRLALPILWQLARRPWGRGLVEPAPAH